MLDIGVDPDVTPITMAFHQGHEPSMRLRALIDHLKGAFGNPPYWDEALTF